MMDTLYSLIKDKPYFIVTSNTDEHFARAGFEPVERFLNWTKACAKCSVPRAVTMAYNQSENRSHHVGTGAGHGSSDQSKAHAISKLHILTLLKT